MYSYKVTQSLRVLTSTAAMWLFVHELMTASLMWMLVLNPGTVNDSWATEHTLQLSACLQYSKQVNERDAKVTVKAILHNNFRIN